MQIIFITGNLTADCEIVASKEGADLVRFTVAANDLKVAGEEKPTFYTCRMTKTGIADYLKCVFAVKKGPGRITEKGST